VLEGVGSAELKYRTVDSMIGAARENLTREAWDYVSGGAGTETTLRRNREAFSRIGFRPRLMQDIRERETSCEVLGVKLSMPAMMAPVGTIAHFDGAGMMTVARVAEEVGTLAVVSTSAVPDLTAVRREVSAPLGYQLYPRGDRDWITERVRIAEEAGVKVLFVTADSAVTGWRERNLANEYRALVNDPSQLKFQEFFTWRDFEWLRGVTSLPLGVKGITSSQDARRAIEVGADCVYVSNHGGRQLDCLPATIEVVPEIVEEVRSEAEVIVDGGFIHGSDVVKALALGAKSVLIGRLMVWALAAAGDVGLRRAMDLLHEEILNTMALLGVTSVSELNPDYVRSVEPVNSPEWIGFFAGRGVG
jgi:isopentenyl diphosphate isomerase/L-lactate dehydrogenase-like FMN-dependent dehydrogenase